MSEYYVVMISRGGQVLSISLIESPSRRKAIEMALTDTRREQKLATSVQLSPKVLFASADEEEARKLLKALGAEMENADV